MAPRKQTKVAESVVADANGDASPPRKRKAATATKPVAEESKQVRGLRRGKAEKAEINDNMVIDTSPPKRARGGGGRNKTAEPKPAVETKSGRSNKVAKAEETINNNAHEKAPKQTTEKKARAAKTTGAMAKKAGTKEQPAAKPKAKESARKPRNNIAATENGAGGNTTEMDVAATSTKRTRGKVMEKENAMPAARTATAAKAPKKRKNVEEKTIEDAEVVEEEAAVTVPDKKPRGKPKKAAGAQAANEQVKPRGRAKKNTAKAEPAKLSKEIEEEEKESNTAEQEDSAKTDSTKNTKKGNAKKVAPKGKRNTALEKDQDAQADEAADAEADVQENGKIENVQSKQQKKRNMGKANATMKEKTEARGRQKKGQVAAAEDVKEIAKDANVEDDAAEKVNTVSEAQDESDANEVAQSDNASNKKEAKGEADQVKLPESVDSEQPIENEILESEANTSTDKDEN
ncbi:cylicin-2-like isoform X2 [Odontomachus brunneus]|uniref:cylicin-2-like isoform X2 n=1 Tax=Odontomachus brunneus TaxID=486640 RepID=UPI0013F22CF6|nr:cylicin-2-like isoform X2 [Odontomachus brunneus]